MRYGPALLASFALAAAPAHAGAQDSTATGWPRLGVGAGVDIRRVGGVGDTPTHATVSLDWRRPSNALGLRLEALYARDQSSGGGLLGCVDCAWSQGRTDLGLLVSGTYTFRQRSRLRPYLVSGAGLYHRRTRFDADLTACASVACVLPARGTPIRYGDTMLGLNAGAGLEWRLGRRTLFGELRYHLLDDRRTQSFTPVTFGIRF